MGRRVPAWRCRTNGAGMTSSGNLAPCASASPGRWDDGFYRVSGHCSTVETGEGGGAPGGFVAEAARIWLDVENVALAPQHVQIWQPVEPGTLTRLALHAEVAPPAVDHVIKEGVQQPDDRLRRAGHPAGRPGARNARELRRVR